MVRVSSTQGHKWVQNALESLKYILLSEGVSFVQKKRKKKVTIASLVRWPDWNMWWNRVGYTPNNHRNPTQVTTPERHAAGSTQCARRYSPRRIVIRVTCQVKKTRQRGRGRVYLGDLEQYDAVLDGLYHALERRREEEDSVTSRR